MSFCLDVKKELSAIEMISPCCMHAEAYGMLIFGRAFSNTAISISTENNDVASLYAEFIRSEFGIEPEIKNGSGQMQTVYVKKAADRRKILEAFSHSPNEPTLRINRANLADDCCFASFVRGAFLSCGNVSSPQKNYHMEFVIPYLKLSNDLFSVLNEMSVKPKHVLRKSSHVIYFKNSEKIEDMLTMMGAINSSLKIMSIKVEKDMRNRINRCVNFDTANIDRSVGAGMAQVAAIEKIKKKLGLESLPEPLRRTAELRLENPEAPLSELERLSDGKISRSGINHRLEKLVKIAEEIK